MPLFAKKTESPEFYRFFKNVLGFTPRRVELYRTAFIHRSVSAESEGHRINNERLEYLGDAVLGAVVAEYLYKKYPLKGEGFLTEMRSKIVSRKSLGQLARKIGMQELIQHQRGGEGAFKSIGGDAFEALIGAIYIERGYRFTRKIIIDKMLRTYIDVDEVAQTDWNYKGKLIDWGSEEPPEGDVRDSAQHGARALRAQGVRVLCEHRRQAAAVGCGVHRQGGGTAGGGEDLQSHGGCRQDEACLRYEIRHRSRTSSYPFGDKTEKKSLHPCKFCILYIPLQKVQHVVLLCIVSTNNKIGQL